MSKDNLGDRMKLYEKAETGRRFMPLLPIMARLDGRSFSKFCRSLERPYDKRMSDLMVAVTTYLVEETGALIGYTQSDEITLMWYSNSILSQTFFDGKIFKMNSVLAALCTVKFNQLMPDYLPENSEALPVFDCRVWQVPSLVEAANVFVWREQDATRNSVSMAAQSMFSHRELQKKSVIKMVAMMESHFDVLWSEYPTFFKRGTYIKRVRKVTGFTEQERERLPEGHMARRNPALKFLRQIVCTVDLPPISKIEAKVELLFN